MRHRRRGGTSVLELGGSGADSFVAVVVTKLTGALLFILLLAMVIMALLPKSADWPAIVSTGETERLAPLEITTPEVLPEAIVGRPYHLALAAQGGRGSLLRWGLDGDLPEGLAFDSETALISGTPKAGTPEAVGLLARVSDGSERSARRLRLVVYQSDQPLITPNWWTPGLPPIPWRAWLEQGFGFLMLLLVHMVGMSALAALQRRSMVLAGADGTNLGRLRQRFAFYRACVRLATLSAAVGLATWLWLHLG